VSEHISELLARGASTAAGKRRRRVEAAE